MPEVDKEKIFSDALVGGLVHSPKFSVSALLGNRQQPQHAQANPKKQKMAIHFATDSNIRDEESFDLPWLQVT